MASQGTQKRHLTIAHVQAALVESAWRGEGLSPLNRLEDEDPV